MNDLAEKALRGVAAGRRILAARPVPFLAGAGFVVSAVAVVAGARIGAAPAALPLNRWLGLLPRAGYRVRGPLFGAVLLVAIVVLVLLWLAALHTIRRGRASERSVWLLAGIWAVPFAAAPPLLSTDVFGYVAHGLLARGGRDPYVHPPSALGDLALVNAVDPTWRGTPSTGGPVSTLVEHLAVSAAGGSALGAVLLLRAVAVLSTVAIGKLAADLAGPRRADALGLTVLNPALLIYVVSGAHFEGLLGALLLGALVAAAARRWLLAVVLACAAAGVKPIALIAVVAVIAAHAFGRRREVAWRHAARDTVVAAAALAVAVFVVPDGLGWARNVNAAIHEHTAFAPSSVISDVVSAIVPSASFDDLAVGGRIAVGLAGLTVVVYLLVTVRERPLDRTVGFALLAPALLGPVLFPWYLLWGLVCLAPTATRGRRDWVVALSAAACVLAPVGFTTQQGQIATLCGLALVAAGLVPRLVVRQQRTVAARRAAGVNADGRRGARRGPARS